MSHTGIKKFAVFVFPKLLKFNAGSKVTLKKIFSIYNPYDFAVKYRVLCTSPDKYVVKEPKGSIGPGMMADIIVKHIMPTPDNYNITDKFQVQMIDISTNKVIGQTEIDTILVEDEDILEEDDTPKHHRRTSLADEGSVKEGLISDGLPRGDLKMYVGSVTLVICCSIILMLPTQEDNDITLPSYLYVSVSTKLVVAFILGFIIRGLIF